MSELEEKKNRKIGWSISIGIHLAVLLLFIFLLAWREPNPPYPEYGIEINFGTDEVGGGEIQPENEASAEEETEQPSQEEQVQDEVQEQPQKEESEEVIPEVVEDTESPDVVEEKPTETKVETVPVKKEEVKKEITPPTTNPTKQKEETPVAETEKKAEESESTSQGDNTNKTGDKGDPEGDLDSRALYGNKGGGDGGNSLELNGWDWGDKPKEDPFSETGYIIFKIAVDENGEVIQALPETYSVSLQVVRHYQNELMKLTFRRISNSSPPPRSEGKLTIRLKKN